MSASEHLGPQWQHYDRLPHEAKQAVRHWSHDADPDEVEHYARRKQWQVEHVPTEEVKKRVMQSGEHAEEHGGDWESYHRWYVSRGGVPEHGSSRWPVIEAPPETRDEGYLDDGWHRLHSYVRAGDTHIPVLRSRRVT